MPRHATEAGHGRRVVAGALGALAISLWAVAYRTYGGTYLSITLLVPTVTLMAVLFSVAMPGRRYTHRTMARGRVIAIISAFNEDPLALHGTVRSLLEGTRPPDEIHVVDDGSDEPLEPYWHPRVHWHRREQNGGKRKGQQTALLTIEPRDADFILTVDSDCTVDRFAVQRLLQAMSDESIQAATGLPLARNRTGVLTRIIDLEIASICLTYRAARSMLGSLTTCSGALSMYRAGVLLDNLERYAGEKVPAGDDRRLTHFALLRGKVVSVAEAKVHTDMPTSLRKLYRQRVRWSTSHWRYKPWEMAYLPADSMLWSAYQTILTTIVPIALVWTFVVTPAVGQGFPWQLLAYWSVACWLVTVKYVAGRPDMRFGERLVIWLFCVPLLMAVQLFLYRPAMLHALFKVRSTGWGTRGNQAKAVRGRYRLAA